MYTGMHVCILYIHTYIPQLDRFIKATRDEHVLMLIDAKDNIVVSAIFDQGIAGNDIPQANLACAHTKKEKNESSQKESQ